MSLKVEILGVKETIQFLRDSGKKIDNNAMQGINQAALFMQGEVKESIAGRRAEPTSVDTGRFLNSISLATSKNQAIIFTDIEYAKFLEYGTSRIFPRMHFRNSMFRNQDNIFRIVYNQTIKT